jgi:hypothetical protein
VRQREKKLISFVLPDSSSDKEDVNFSSGEDIVVGNSCEEEDDDVTSFFLLTLLSITLSVVLDCSGDFSISLVTESTDLE